MHEDQLLEVIKKAALAAVEAAMPMRVMFGKVTDTSPLTVRVGQKLPLSGDMLVVAAGTTPLNGICSTCGKITVRDPLKPGDKVILLRMQGGQKYILLDRVV